MSLLPRASPLDGCAPTLNPISGSPLPIDRERKSGAELNGTMNEMEMSNEKCSPAFHFQMLIEPPPLPLFTCWFLAPTI